ncbi:glycosyltransferase [Flavobacterium faecale]|uniref:Glycosyltransferase n=1 Tax=Flavobacterium faecale TaxID=1355330 RepID=A0A2S1LBL8_9FLAO|nr:glycosyltransferase [Flavobacterium faecale]AWG21140.1 glycosyltransferase [Flavobacterium faecale]
MEIEYENRTILVTVLNWGLGHATRCIPIIKMLHYYNFTPIIASDGPALALLKKEFPYILCLQLPSNAIEYPKNGNHFKRKLLQNLPKIALTIREEHKLINQWIKKYEIIGIISDNRMGCYSTQVPSVYITHQITVLTGNTTWWSTKLHQYFIKKFTVCWVPDHQKEPNLGGKLSHTATTNELRLEYIGPVSRFHIHEAEQKYDLLILLSGPEPQREMLEIHLIEQLKNYEGKVLFVKGIIEAVQKKEEIGNVLYYNFMKARQLEQCIQESAIVLCRSGYTTIMDLERLNKKAFFIPTPGQFEQMYLAEKFETEKIAPFADQDNFKIEDLAQVSSYKGFKHSQNEVDWVDLLKIFEN